MTSRLTIESVGPGATIQDGGRFGALRYGVTPAGPMDWVAHATANRALGNPLDMAAIEIGPGGVSVSVDAATMLAFAGGAFVWTRGATRLPTAARIVLLPGEILRARAGAWGSFATLAVAGGLDIPVIMHSRATHTRSGIGGLDGRWLRAGDELGLSGHGEAKEDVAIEAPWLAAFESPIRVVLGPQDDYFSPDTIAAFCAEPYALTSQADRMAYKLAGPRLDHAKDFNIVSDGVALGAIQIAGDGQPLVLMADRQPTGGYAKLAHVCRADIGRLAQLRPGETCRFAVIGVEAARDALLALEDRVAETATCLVPLRRAPTTEGLLGVNLIGGVTDGG